MRVAVSPYHLTTREPAALVPLLLAESVVTLLPAPESGRGRDDVQRAAASVPSYLRFMESWSWSMPLWRDGVIAPALDGRDATEDVREAHQRIDRESPLSPLRGLMRPELFESQDTYLEAVSRDVLRAGPDPGITVPVTAGLDAFAARHGALVARAEPTSIVQRAEAGLGKRVLSVALPVLAEASAERLLVARELLADALVPLRNAFGAVVERGRDEAGEVAMAAREYAIAFDESRDDILDSADDDEDLRAVQGTAAITILALPPDAALNASLSAVRTMVGGDTDSNSPVVVVGRPGLMKGRGVFAMIIKLMGRSQSPRRR